MSVVFPDGVVVRVAEPLARHCSARVGGASGAFVVVHDRQALPATLIACRESGWQRTLIGAGTRTVFRDGGLAGAVIRLGTGFSFCEEDSVGWRIGGALPTAVVGARCVDPDLADLLRWPGSFGASVTLDDGPGAGWDAWIDEVRFIRRGREVSGTLADYREAPGASILLEARLRREPTRRSRARRKPSWPGAWYAAPVKGDLRGIMRRVALDQTRLRKVMIPHSAPELVVNLGGASASDLALLHASATERVHKERGIKLESAVRWAGRV